MLTSLEVMADRYLYPVGDISQAELLERHDAFRRNYENYEVLTEIDGLPTDLEVKILFGTWCHDSEREVPIARTVMSRSATCPRRTKYKQCAGSPCRQSTFPPWITS